MSLPKYCSLPTTPKAPGWDHAAPPRDLSFACPFALRAPWLTRHHPLTRCASYHPCLHCADPAWLGPGWPGREGDAADTRVLARWEPDGFYYPAQIKASPELERQGTLLVEYEGPLGPKLPAQQQSVVLEEDVIGLSPSVGYALYLGDKVLAPWEPDQQRYGPGTVAWGLETRDSQRASKKEEITVHFWNGKTAKVPLGEVWWVPLAVWKRAVERLPKTFTGEHPRPRHRAPCCSLLGSATGCIASGLPLGTPFLCAPCHPHTCCQLLSQGCLCCCPLAGPTWWPSAQTSQVTAGELPKSKLSPTAQLLPPEGPKEEEVAVPASVALPSFSSSSSPSSSSEEEDAVENDLQMGLPQRLMVNSAVNTDPILLEDSPRQRGLCQPEWRYWRRNGPEPHPRKPGIRRCNIWKEERENKQERVQIVGVRIPKELALKATNTKPPRTLPEEAEHRKFNLGIVTHQRDKNSPRLKS
ncbi:uncharacterized protein C11orf16 homolog isoform X1 [Nycticebus coucang]|uniref:uncharacterized protein C11orf16 homolog isoform X1 n=1 Tax=Nycticebus coucang TaxID=9470 RepID=UPI00234C3B72|nr:uncharacterized protein C11orf16 homolog isoform X1 [Nycticebus coucang]